MKIRQGFVSNSSSSSFVLRKSVLTNEQINEILNFKEKRNDWFETEIREESDYFVGYLECHNGTDEDGGSTAEDIFLNMLSNWGLLNSENYASEYCGSIEDCKERVRTADENKIMFC